ncbi:hypothetical protein [Proteus faecis]|uniref:hypothetical protein n=1 Tax=Proteus faecis TaxID=2050967 RepID=UPI0021BB2A8D|nr:hypothetical protein [Proteus faecis]MCT8249857.1 hypothetical protein [Proteus faecis]
MTNEIKSVISKLIPIGIYDGSKERHRVKKVRNSNNTYIKKNEKQKENIFSLNNANNYVYLGSTNTSLLNNMGITLADDGSLLLIKGKTHDLFTGLYNKHFKGGFKYNVFNIESQQGDNMKFKELYVDPNGFLIGNKRSENKSDSAEENKNELYKIKFNKVEKDYNLNDSSSNSIENSFIVEYEKYIIDDELKQDLSSINNIVELKESNVLKINREGLDLSVSLKDNMLYIKGLPKEIISSDQVDSGKIEESNVVEHREVEHREVERKEVEHKEVEHKEVEHKIKIPLKSTDKILAIKPILNQIQLVVDKGNKIKIYYLDPLNIFSLKDYQYEVTRLKQEPPLSFYSMVGENHYNNYHSGQPFSTQKIGNFSSRYIPLFSSLIDKVRISIDKTKQQYALKQYKSMASNVAKTVDPGFRGVVSNIKGISNSSTSPCENKFKALHSARINMKEADQILSKYIKGVKNSKTAGEVIYSLVKEMKEKSSVSIMDSKGIRAFFSTNLMSLNANIGVNAFILASYAKTHSITLSKNEKNEVIFSFINKKGINVSAGLSGGIAGCEKKWIGENVSYNATTSLMASVYLSINYERQSDFSFKIALDDVVDFIDKGMKFTYEELKNNTILNDNRDISLAISADMRSEFNAGVNLSLGNKTQMSIPRNAIGINVVANLLKLNFNINKFFDYGEMSEAKKKKVIDLKLFEILLDAYRDLKIIPSKTNSTKANNWLPLATIKNIEFMFQKKINSLFGVDIFNSQKLKDEREFENKRKNLKGIYKRVLKINKLFDENPTFYNVNKNISKLDGIHLTMLPNKKLKNKMKKDPVLLNEMEVISKFDKLKGGNNFKNQFLLDLEARKKTLSSQEKSNKNERFKSYSVFQYKLDKKSEVIYEKAREDFNKKINEIMENKNITNDYIKSTLSNLYDKIKDDFSKMKYQLSSIDIMSISELLEKDKSIPLVLVELENAKGIIYHQIKGEIKFSYDEDNEQLDKMSTNYYF